MHVNSLRTSNSCAAHSLVLPVLPRPKNSVFTLKICFGVGSHEKWSTPDPTRTGCVFVCVFVFVSRFVCFGNPTHVCFSWGGFLLIPRKITKRFLFVFPFGFPFLVPLFGAPFSSPFYAASQVKQGAPPQYFHGYRRGRELGRGASGQVFVCNKRLGLVSRPEGQKSTRACRGESK